MRKWTWKKWAVALVSGSLLLQAASCAQTATVITSISSLVTAGGVLFLVNRVLSN